MTATNYLEEKILGHVLNVANYPSPTAGNNRLYLALSNQVTTKSGAVSGAAWPGEISGKGYRRALIEGFKTIDNAVAGSVENIGIIQFPKATESWGTIRSLAIFDDDSGGNMLYYESQRIIPIQAGEKLAYSSNVIVDLHVDTVNNGEWSYVFADKIIKHIFLGQHYSPETLYAKPTDESVRVQYTGTWSTPSQNIGGEFESTNNSKIEFPESESGWQDLFEMLLQNADGDDLFQLTSMESYNPTVDPGDIPFIDIGNIACLSH